jgi:hypothetical protein
VPSLVSICWRVLFSHHRFPGAASATVPIGAFRRNREPIWLKEEIETGALHRMMQNEPVADDVGVICTTWGQPNQLCAALIGVPAVLGAVWRRHRAGILAAPLPFKPPVESHLGDALNGSWR